MTAQPAEPIAPEQILDTKLFHHGNLKLCLIYNRLFDIYTLSVFRENSGEEFDMWGLFLDEPEARRKFESIRL